MKIAISGFGREGKSLLKFLRSRGFSRMENTSRIFADTRKKIWVLDKNPKIKVPRGVKKQLGKNYLKDLDRFDLIFRSPGVPYNLPELKRARDKGIRFSSATRIFFEISPTKNVIGVTGTKGKGTTATLIYKILKAAGKDVYLAGNIGKPALGLLPKLKKNSIVVLELSSFQLQDLERSPHIAMILDLFPEHQDAHKNLREYYEAKANICRYQTPGDTVFFFAGNAMSKRIARRGRGEKIAVRPHSPLFVPRDLKLRGFHSYRNAVMAATVARSLGVPRHTILQIVKKFRGLPHRLEVVRTIRYSNVLKNLRISFYNDSAATNPHTAAAAIRAFADESTILIAGGRSKVHDYRPVANALKRSSVRLVVLFGENKGEIREAIKHSGVPVKVVGTLKAAVQTAYASARRFLKGSNGNRCAIVFSPSAASFDQFRNYADRGRQFKKFVKSLRTS